MVIRPDKMGRRGTVLVESALIIPIFLMFIFMIVEFAFFMSVRHTLENAARIGVRYASVNMNQGAGLTAATQAIVMTNMGYYGTTGIVIGIAPPPTYPGTTTFQTPFTTSNILVRGYDGGANGGVAGTLLAAPENCNLLDQVAVEIYAAYKPIVPVTRLLGIFGIFQGNVNCVVNVRETAEYN